MRQLRAGFLAPGGTGRWERPSVPRSGTHRTNHRNRHAMESSLPSDLLNVSKKGTRSHRELLRCRFLVISMAFRRSIGDATRLSCAGTRWIATIRSARFRWSIKDFFLVTKISVPYRDRASPRPEEAMGRTVYRIETRRTSAIVRSLPMVAMEISNPWWRRRRGCNLGGRAAAQPRQPLRRNCSPGRRGRRGAPERYALRDRP